MKEKFNPKLKKDEKSYEKILKKAGMPDRIRREKFPDNLVSRGETLFRLIPEMGLPALESFLSLESETQDGIIEDIKKHREEGMEKEPLLARLKKLIEESQKFELMSASDSDKNYKPQTKPSLQDLERREAEEFAAGTSEKQKLEED